MQPYRMDVELRISATGELVQSASSIIDPSSPTIRHEPLDIDTEIAALCKGRDAVLTRTKVTGGREVKRRQWTIWFTDELCTITGEEGDISLIPLGERFNGLVSFTAFEEPQSAFYHGLSIPRKFIAQDDGGYVDFEDDSRPMIGAVHALGEDYYHGYVLIRAHDGNLYVVFRHDVELPQAPKPQPLKPALPVTREEFDTLAAEVERLKEIIAGLTEGEAS